MERGKGERGEVLETKVTRKKGNKKKRKNTLKGRNVIHLTSTGLDGTSTNVLDNRSSTSSSSSTSSGALDAVINSDRMTTAKSEITKGRASSKKKRPREDTSSGVSTINNNRNINSVSSNKHPFPTEYGDHFETPLRAYQDIEGALSLLAKRLGKKRKHLRIWDPYVSPKPDITI